MKLIIKEKANIINKNHNHYKYHYTADVWYNEETKFLSIDFRIFRGEQFIVKMGISSYYDGETSASPERTALQLIDETIQKSESHQI